MRILVKARPDRIRASLPWALALLIFFAMALSGPALAATAAERAKTPALDFNRYAFDPETPLAERVAAPPGFVMDYLRAYDERPDYAPHALTPKERALVEKDLAALPPGYRAVLQERLLGLYFVNHFMGSGFTEFVLAEDGRVFSFMVFNSDVLKAGLSDWLTQKENTAFKPDTDRVKIVVDCGKKARALTWILLHEATHAVDYARDITPYVEPALWELQGRPARTSAFTRGIWADYDTPEATVKWPYAGQVRFYGFGKGPGLDLSRAPAIYETLAKTPFSSLYATKTWAEDLAEQMAFYHLTRTYNLPYEIRVLRDGKVAARFQPFEKKDSPCQAREMPESLK